jgi:transposase
VIQITPHMRILVAVEPADFRRGIDGLAQLCRDALASDPLGGALFVFRNRRGTSLKLLTYDGQGFWLAQKRLSRGKFRRWPSARAGGGLSLSVQQLQLLLWNGDPQAAITSPAWRPLPVVG